mmetsp:Transcript_146439/g.467809  ORF Transcript_146439/g.467809 Transcript_146439/m.467809 type:complete len:619 (+) Transcript_146439:69-1925(+)
MAVLRLLLLKVGIVVLLSAPCALCIEQASVWDVEGNCSLVGRCVTSANYPSNYGNSEACTITALEAGTMQMEVFDTESCCDTFEVSGSTYGGTAGPPRVVLAVGGILSWTSDESEVHAGWKLCFREPEADQASGWDVQGSCSIVGRCVTSANYPSDYGRSQACTITALEAGTMKVEAFDIEPCCDMLEVKVNGSTYGGTKGPQGVVLDVGDILSWTSDGSAVESGWKLCLPQAECCNVSDDDCGVGFLYNEAKSAELCAGTTCDASGVDRATCCMAQAECYSVTDDDCGVGFLYNESNSAEFCGGTTCDASGVDRATCCMAQAECYSVTDDDCGVGFFVYGHSKNGELCAGTMCDASGVDRATCCIAQGEVVQISGSWTLRLAEGTNLDAFMIDPTVKDAMVATVATITGMPPKNIKVSRSVRGRRLQVEAIPIEAAGPGGRRLAASILVSYFVRVERQDATRVQQALVAADSSAVTSVLAAQMAAKGLGSYSVVLTGVTAPVVTDLKAVGAVPDAGGEDAASGTVVAAVLGAIVICCLGSGCAFYAAMRHHRKKSPQAEEAEQAVGDAEAVGAVEAVGAKDVAEKVEAVEAAGEAHGVSVDAEAKDENSDDERFFSL